MRKLIVAAAVLISTCISAQNFAENRIVLSLKANRLAYSSYTAFENLNHKYLVQEIKQIGPSGRKIITSVHSDASSDGMIVLQFEQTIDVIAVISEYKQLGIFKYVEPDYKGGGESTIPNDPIFGSKQYYHVNSGNFNETPSHGAVVGADMDTDLAWDITTGNSSVVLGVFDSGLDFTNTEFLGRHWVNNDEIPNNNIDDDNNGYVDDVNGWDFVNEDNNPTDDHSHGTNVTGIAAATGNNNFGMAGVDWNCKIMTLKVLASDNSGYYSDWSEALYYAANNGFDVGNLSLSGSSYSQSFNDAVDYAHNSGGLVVVAMGNDDYGTVRYPAGFSNAMAIGATNPDDTRVNQSTNPSWGSNYGSHIDCVAAGQRVYSARHNNNTSFTWWKGGTSMATPLVAGVACLMKGVNPYLTPNEIRQAINATAEDQVGNPSEDIAGFDHYYGHGRINAHQAVLEALTITSTEEISIQLSVYPNPVRNVLTVQSVEDIIIYNMQGGIVGTYSGTGVMHISTSDWAQGIYLVKSGSTVQKIVKK